MSNALLSSKTVVTEEAPSIGKITALPTAVLATVGVTQRGAIGVAKFFTSFEEWRAEYGDATLDSLETWAAIQGFFETGGQFLWFTRTAHYTDIGNVATLTAATAEVTAQSAVATSAVLVGSNAGPYDLEPGDSVTVAVDQGVPVAATIAATASSSATAGAGPYALTDTNTLIVEIDSGPAQTVVFNTGDFVDIANATALEVAAVLNAGLNGCSINVVGGNVVMA